MSDKTPKRSSIGAQFSKQEIPSTNVEDDIAIAAARAREVEYGKEYALEKMDRLNCEFQDVDFAFHKSHSSDSLDLDSLYKLAHDQETLLNRLQKLHKESSRWLATDNPYNDFARLQFIVTETSSMIEELEERVDYLEDKYYSSKILNMKTRAELEREVALWRKIPQNRVSPELKKRAPKMLNLCEAALLRILES